tara:strand:- start:2278 stop:2664 length:387 start_codon:yes stop_codon:yes gene_type:complete
MLNEKKLIDIVTQKYFSNVDLKRLDDVLNCFLPEATLAIQTDNLVHVGREKGIRRMFGDFFNAYKIIWHGNFKPIVDVDRQSVAVQFNALRLRFDGFEERAQNINIFKFQDNFFSKVTIFMSDENPLV